MTAHNPPSLRPMSRSDLPAVMDLERTLFPEDAWSEGMFAAELTARSRHYVVAAGGSGEIIGYAGLASAADEGDVLTIGVRPGQQGRGLGSQLLTALLDEAAVRGCRAVYLDVRADNERARTLYERFGFTQVGVRERYYQPSGVDAIVMCKCPIQRSGHPEEARAGRPAHGASGPGRWPASESPSRRKPDDA